VELHRIKARDIPEAWYRLLRHCLEEGRICWTPLGADAGQFRLSLDLVALEILHPGRKPSIPTLPSGYPAPVDEAAIQRWLLTILSEINQWEVPNFYGAFLEAQIGKAVEILRDEANWDTYTVCLSTGAEHSLYLPDPWVLKVMDLRIIERKLHSIIYLSTVELYQTLPLFANVFQEIKEYIASCIGAEDGKLFIMGKDFCLFRYMWKIVQELCPGVERPLEDEVKFLEEKGPNVGTHHHQGRKRSRSSSEHPGLCKS